MREPVTLDVGMDLDGCNVWFDRAYYAGCVKLGLIPEGTRWRPPTSWSFYEDYGHDLATFLANCHALADAGLLWNGPTIPGTKTMWNSLIEAGHRIHVKTDRAFGTHPIASEVATRLWLATERRPYHSLTFGADKTAGPRCHIMLEDKLENYDALEAAGVYAVLVNREWNKAPGDTRRRIDRPDQFTEHVMMFAAAAADHPELVA